MNHLAYQNDKLNRKLARTINLYGQKTRIIERNITQQSEVVGQCQVQGLDIVRRAQEQAEFLR